jgi:hypothetical protein
VFNAGHSAETFQIPAFVYFLKDELRLCAAVSPWF